MATMTVKRSHMITRSYLESWANERNLVYVKDLESTERTESINSATVVKYGYRTEHTTLDLENHYSAIEGNGVRAFKALQNDQILNEAGQQAVVAFLDMHLERGRYADQAKETTTVVKGDLKTGSAEAVSLGLGDRLALAKSVDTDAVRLSMRDVRAMRWHVLKADGLVTGDGAVGLWQNSNPASLAAVTFPISPKHLLAIGATEHLFSVELNDLVIANSRRWIVARLQDVVGRDNRRLG